MLTILQDLFRPRWLVLTLVVFFVAVHLSYVAKLSHSEAGNRSAFLRWRAQLHDLDDGVNVWDKYAYPNPPIMAMILKPFMQLPPLLGASLWFWCKAALTLVSIGLVLSLLDEPGRPFPAWGRLLAVALTLRPIEGDLVHGNVNLFILFLVASACYAFCQRRDMLAGVILGLAIACKVTPALFVVYFLWKRAWLALLGVSVGLVLFVLLAPALAFGWHDNLAYLRSWHRQMVAPYAAGVVTSEHKNQSLPGLVHRMLSDAPSISDYDGDRKIVLDTHNIASLGPVALQAIIAASFVLYLVISAWHSRTSLETRPRLALVAEFSLVALGMLLFCERTWKHHGVILLLPFGVLAWATSTAAMSWPVRWRFGIVLALAAALMFSTSSGHVDAGLDSDARFGKWMQVYGAYTWAFLLLLGSVIAFLRLLPGGVQASSQALQAKAPRTAARPTPASATSCGSSTGAGTETTPR